MKPGTSEDGKQVGTDPIAEHGTSASRPVPNTMFWLWRGRVLEWLGEIVIVFVGVYAAFLLNAWQMERQDRIRHLEILRSLDEQETEAVETCKAAITANQQVVDTFQRKLEAGEMPALHLLEFSTDYDPADDVALAQAGADHLLNVRTVQALKKVSSVERGGFMTLRDRQQQALQLIGPRLNDPNDTFYDPKTKKLKPMFAWYLEALNEMIEFMRDMLTVNEALLTQVRAERAELR
jgi:hypothetical protein